MTTSAECIVPNARVSRWSCRTIHNSQWEWGNEEMGGGGWRGGFRGLGFRRMGRNGETLGIVFFWNKDNVHSTNKQNSMHTHLFSWNIHIHTMYICRGMHKIHPISATGASCTTHFILWNQEIIYTQVVYVYVWKEDSIFIEQKKTAAANLFRSMTNHTFSTWAKATKSSFIIWLAACRRCLLCDWILLKSAVGNVYWEKGTWHSDSVILCDYLELQFFFCFYPLEWFSISMILLHFIPGYCSFVVFLFYSFRDLRARDTFFLLLLNLRLSVTHIQSSQSDLFFRTISDRSTVFYFSIPLSLCRAKVYFLRNRFKTNLEFWTELVLMSSWCIRKCRFQGRSNSIMWVLTRNIFCMPSSSSICSIIAFIWSYNLNILLSYTLLFVSILAFPNFLPFLCYLITFNQRFMWFYYTSMQLYILTLLQMQLHFEMIFKFTIFVFVSFE